jgi:2-oxoisovalerate dehydrogenase E2 component (dihydrolipoyl transacylase)
MDLQFNLPDLGEGLQEAEIVRWHAAVGDRLTVDQPLVAVETAKAVVEVPSPFAGVVTALHGKPGDTVATGSPLVNYTTEASVLAAAAADAAAAARGTIATATGGVVGHMPVSDELIEATALQARARDAATRVRAVPAARALARSLGLDIELLAGSGEGGIVTLQDVLDASPSTRPQKATDARLSIATSSMRPSNGLADSGEIEVLRSLRRAMAQSMSLARDSVMECTVFDDADIDGWRQGGDYTVRLLRAIAAGCRAEPGLNAWFDGTTQGRRIFHHIQVGIAVDTREGLLVPVIRDVGTLDAAGLRAEIDRLKAGARARSLPATDLRDFTFMLSNFGVLAGRYATPVVVPPAVAILGAGRISRDVVAVDDRIEVHRRMPLSLTFDHRCVTGGEAVRFLAVVIADLELPE